jgi:predicted Zn-dependent protease
VAADQWPPPPPTLGNFVEFAEARDLGWFLRRYWLIVTISAFAGIGLGWLWTHFSPVPYRSEAKVRFMPPQLAGRFVNPNFSMEVEQRLHALTQLASSRLTATRLIEAFQLYPEKRRFYTVADLVPDFRRDLQIYPASSPDGKAVPTLQITFRYPQPETAQKVVQKVVEQIFEENRKYRGDQSMGTTEFLAEQLRAAEERMLDAEARLGEIQDTLHPNTSRALLGENTSRSYVVDSRLRDLRHDRRLLEERRLLKQAEAAQIEAALRGVEARPLDYYYPQVAALVNFWHLHEKEGAAKAHAARMRDRWKPGFADRELAELDLREAEKAVTEFRMEQSRLIKAQDREQVLNKLTLARNELRALEMQDHSAQKEEIELRAEAQRLKERNTAPAGIEAELLNAKREYQTAVDQHSAILKKHEESQAASDMERRGQGETVELLEPPSLPTTSESPTRWVRIGLFGSGSLIAALFLCLMHALRNPSILHSGHIENWAGLEVLATFPAASMRNLGNSKRNAGGKKQTWRKRAVTPTILAFLMVLASCARPFVTAESLWKSGLNAESAGNPQSALLFYRQAIRKDARFAPAYRSAGKLALKQGELVAARDFLARAIEFDTSDASLAIQLADITYQIYFGDPGRPAALLREVESIAVRLQEKWPNNPDGYRIQAQVLLERHRPEEAAALLERASAKIPANESLKTQAASALFRLGRDADAEALLQEVMERFPKYAAAYDLYYLRLMQRGAVADARVLLEAKWTKTSTAEAALQLAAHDDAFGNRDSARRVLEKLVHHPSAGDLVLARIGDFWMHRGEWEQARNCYDEGSRLEPKHATEYISRRAEWFLARKQPGEARALIARELLARPGDLILKAYAAAIALGDATGMDRTEQRRNLEAVLQRMPDSPFVRYHLGRAYMLEGTIKQAVDQFERCVKLDPNYAPGWVALAESELARGNATAAEDRAANVLRRNPRYLPAMLTHAKSQVSRGNAAEAEATLAQIVKLQPDNAEALFLLGTAKFSQGKAGPALEIFAGGRAKTGGDTRWLLAEVEVLLSQGNADAARARLEQARKAGHKEESVLFRLATLELERKDGRNALPILRSLATQNPGSLPYRLALAGAMAMAGDTQQAFSLYDQAEKDYPREALVRLQHAALRAEKNDRDGAIRKYTEALELDKDNPLILNNLAWNILQSNGPAEKALEYSLQARRVFGRSPEIDDTLAAAYLRLGMHRNAEAIYEEMLSYLTGAEQSRVKQTLERLRTQSNGKKQS